VTHEYNQRGDATWTTVNKQHSLLTRVANSNRTTYALTIYNS